MHDDKDELVVAADKLADARRSRTMAAPGLLRTVVLASHFIGLMVVSNVLEEYLYSRLPGFDYYQSVAAVELAAFAAAAWASRPRGEPRRAPLVFYAATGAAMALSQTLGKVANKYVNFSASTVFKCAKALPTMAALALCGRRYDRWDVAAVAAMGGAQCPGNPEKTRGFSTLEASISVSLRPIRLLLGPLIISARVLEIWTQKSIASTRTTSC